jgi:hypothetical protein
MASTISGNIGGSAESGVQVTAFNNTMGLLYTNANASGNYSFSGLVSGTYVIAIGGTLYKKSVSVDGSSTYTNVDLSPSGAF